MSKYGEDKLKKCKDVYNALKYYITRVEELEKENEYLKEAYKNRVNEYLDLKKGGGINVHN